MLEGRLRTETREGRLTMKTILKYRGGAQDVLELTAGREGSLKLDTTGVPAREHKGIMAVKPLKHRLHDSEEKGAVTITSSPRYGENETTTREAPRWCF